MHNLAADKVRCFSLNLEHLQATRKMPVQLNLSKPANQCTRVIQDLLNMMIVLGWLWLMVYFATRPWDSIAWYVWIMGIALQSYLYSGIFIIVHDCIHGSFAKNNPRVNAAVGHILSQFYGFVDYGVLRKSHYLHHLHPATLPDPDYHANEKFWPWFASFLKAYLGWRQLWLFSAAFALAIALRMDLISLLLIWRLPAIFSSLQLFYFGVWLPHKGNQQAVNAAHHNARNLNYPLLVSILACYNFGYHLLHHQKPHLSWWRLGVDYGGLGKKLP